MNVYLIGYRGTGKSSLARILAERLDWPWADADDLVEQRAGMSIAEIFARRGEPGFRELESQVVGELARRDSTVVALGGGAVLREINRQALRDGKVVWLEASVETIERRVSGDPATAARRPNLTAGGGREEIERLLEQRRPLYEQAADYRVATDERTSAEVADEVLRWLEREGEGTRTDA